MQKDASPAHVRVHIRRLDLDGPAILCERILVPALLREEAPHCGVRAGVAGIGQDGPLVPAERLAAPAEPFLGLASDHVPHRRVRIRPVRQLDGLAAEGGGRLVAAGPRPDSPEEPERCQQWRQLRQDRVYVGAHRLRYKVPGVAPGPHPMRAVVAHDVQQVRVVEQHDVPRERARQAHIVERRLDVLDALNSPVDPEQVGRREQGDDPHQLGQIRRRDAQVDGGVHVHFRVEYAPPDLAVEQL